MKQISFSLLMLLRTFDYQLDLVVCLEKAFVTISNVTYEPNRQNPRKNEYMFRSVNQIQYLTRYFQ